MTEPLKMPGLFAFLGVTGRRALVILSESVFLIGGVIVGFRALPVLADAMEQGDFDPGPLAHLAMDWYWVLLVLLAAHILLWPVVPRLLGVFGLVLWWFLGVTLPLLIVGAPVLFVISSYASVIQQTG